MKNLIVLIICAVLGLFCEAEARDIDLQLPRVTLNSDTLELVLNQEIKPLYDEYYPDTTIMMLAFIEDVNYDPRFKKLIVLQEFKNPVLYDDDYKRDFIAYTYIDRFLILFGENFRPYFTSISTEKDTITIKDCYHIISEPGKFNAIIHDPYEWNYFISDKGQIIPVRYNLSLEKSDRLIIFQDRY